MSTGKSGQGIKNRNSNGRKGRTTGEVVAASKNRKISFSNQNSIEEYNPRALEKDLEDSVSEIDNEDLSPQSD